MSATVEPQGTQPTRTATIDRDFLNHLRSLELQVVSVTNRHARAQADLAREREEAQRQQASLARQLSNLNDERDQLNQQIERGQGDRAQLQAQLAQLQPHVDRLVSERAELTRQLNMRQSNVDSLQQELAELQRQLGQATLKISRLEDSEALRLRIRAEDRQDANLELDRQAETDRIARLRRREENERQDQLDELAHKRRLKELKAHKEPTHLKGTRWTKAVVGGSERMVREKYYLGGEEAKAEMKLRKDEEAARRAERDSMYKFIALLILIALLAGITLLFGHVFGGGCDSTPAAPTPAVIVAPAPAPQPAVAPCPGDVCAPICRDTAPFVDRDGRHCFVKVCGADSTLFCEGLDGKDGVDGQDGVDGKRGRPGKNGLDGAPGTPGPKGETGPQGQAAPPAEPTPPATESHKWRASCHGNGNWSPEGTRQHADDVACGRIVVAGCTPTGKLWDGESQGVVGASCK